MDAVEERILGLTTAWRDLADDAARHAALMRVGRAHPPLAEAEKTDAWRVEGCMANLWVVGECRDGRCHLRCDSDSAIIRSVAWMMCEAYSGALPAEIRAHPPSFLRNIGVTAHLTSNRRNALSRLWEAILERAARCEPGKDGAA